MKVVEKLRIVAPAEPRSRTVDDVEQTSSIHNAVGALLLQMITDLAVCMLTKPPTYACGCSVLKLSAQSNISWDAQG